MPLLLRRLACLLLCCSAGVGLAHAQRDRAYAFQHRLLPELFYVRPSIVYQILTQPNAAAILEAIEANMPEGMPDSAQVAGIRKPRYRVSRFDFDTLRIYVVTPPKPKQVLLCHQIGFVFRLPDDSTRMGVIARRYFTLENGSSASYNPVCDWRVSSERFEHGNYGDFQPVNRPQHFAMRIVELLRSGQAPVQGVKLPNPGAAPDSSGARPGNSSGDSGR